MQWWPSGIEQGPDGVVRELPQRHVWASSIWVTQEGTARRKWWNPVERRWRWDAEPLPIIVVDGRAGVNQQPRNAAGAIASGRDERNDDKVDTVTTTNKGEPTSSSQSRTTTTQPLER